MISLGDSIVIRIPATFTFDTGSSSVKPQIDATLLEIARTVKTMNQTFVDVLAHTDTTGTPQGNLALSQKRAAAVAAYLGGARRCKGADRLARTWRIGAAVQSGRDGNTEAANRRIEIRLVPYLG